MEEQKERRNLHELLETPEWQAQIHQWTRQTLEYRRRKRRPRHRPVNAPIPIGSPTKWA